MVDTIADLLAGLEAQPQDTEALDVLRRSLARGGDAERIGGLIEAIEKAEREKE